MGIQISPAKIQKLQDLLFNLSYLIIFMWSMTTDVIIEYGEVQYSSPMYILPVMLGLDFLQLGTTSLYAILYYKCKFALANYRAQKKKEQEEENEKKQRDLAGDGGKGEEEKKGLSYTLGQVGGWLGDKWNNNPLVIFSANDEKFSNVMMFFLTSLFGTFYDQKLFMLYILYYFMQN